MADLKQFERKMEKTLEVLASDFGAVRAGRANAQVLDRITVEYYGTPTPIGQISISSLSFLPHISSTFLMYLSVRS